MGDQIERVIRDRQLTREEVARDQSVREQAEYEFPPSSLTNRTTSPAQTRHRSLTAGDLVPAALSLIPGMGNFLSSLYSEWSGLRREIRLRETLDDIIWQLTDLRGMLQVDRIGDSHFHFLEDVLNHASAEHSELKRKQFANLLVSHWVGDDPYVAEIDEAALFLRATSEFTEAHIDVLRVLEIAGPQAAVPFAELSARPISQRVGSQEKRIALLVIEDLCGRYALATRSWTLNEAAKGKPFITGNLSPEGISRGCFHAINDRGIRYIKYVLTGMAE